MLRLLLVAMVVATLASSLFVVAPYYPTETYAPIVRSADPPSWQPVTPKLVVEAEHSMKVALTFDAASWPALQPAILDALRGAGVRCTMFLTGDFVDMYPEEVVQMAKDGHEIGNHSNTHRDMPSISSPEMVAELDDFDSKVVALTGKSTRPWFRPPSGSYNDRVIEVAAQRGYYTIYWTADSGDWRNDVEAATVKQRLLRYATPGAILVAHLTSPQTAEVLPEVLDVLKGRGVEFSTVSELLGNLD